MTITSPVGITLRQSDIKLWQRCPLAWKYQNIDQLPRELSASSVFGSIVHACVRHMEVNQDLPGALQLFHTYWDNPLLLTPSPGDPPYRIDYYVRGTTWRKFSDKGPRLLKDWWSIIQWDGDTVLAREYGFEVPAGTNGRGHRLRGTLDKLAIRWMPKFNSFVVLISDYKTNNKAPTYDYLDEDIQFTAYAYATTRPEFWEGLPNGAELYERFRTLPRHAEWVALTIPRRMDAGPRNQQHFNRLHMAVDGIADSVAMRIFIPNVSGESCRYCEFRGPCGLPLLDEDGNLPPHDQEVLLQAASRKPAS